MEKPDKKNIEDIFALTPMQEGMLFHYLKDPKGDHYFEQLSLEMSGEIDIDIFEKAWNFVVETNDMLRTVFRWEKLDKPTQMLLKQHKPDLRFFDLSDMEDHAKKQKQLEKIKLEDRKEKFDLREVPFRVMLCKISGKAYHIVISNHHILYDGWSSGIILTDFFRVYGRLEAGETAPVLPVKPSFKEFVRWHGNRDKDKQKKFWQEYFKGFETQTPLPVKEKSAKINKIPGGNPVKEFGFTLEKGISDRLDTFLKKHRTTLAAFFFCSWGILLQKYCSRDDVVFGTTVSGRTAPINGIENMVGLFINTLPLRVTAKAGETVLDLILKVNEALPHREKYENTPLVDIREYSRRETGQELFDSLLVMENYPLDLPMTIHSYSAVESTNYDLTIVIALHHDIEVRLLYTGELFAKDVILRLSRHFIHILKAITAHPQKQFHEIEILSRAERKQLLVDFNNTNKASGYPHEKSIHRLFEEQVEKTTDNIALHGCMIAWMHGEDVSITYKELNEKSNHLAYLLHEKGVGPDIIVGIMMERSIEMVIGIFGILKAGGAYLPIDPDFPQKRIDYMLKDSAAKILLTAQEIAELFSPKALNNRPKGTNHNSQLERTSLAYIIYTSGSTGKPKGVMVEQPSVVNLLSALQNQYPLMESDVYLLKTSYLFDVSVTELFGWFLEGGRLVILEKEGEKDPGKIVDAIERAGVTHINFVPSMFHTFIETLESCDIAKLSSLKYIFLAGEVLLPTSVNRFRRFNTVIRLENIYGPTEATVYASRYSLNDRKVDGSIPIGKPLPDVCLYILNKWGNLQPIGVPGELCIGGNGLARGYLNNPRLTTEKFDHDLRNLHDYHDEINKSFCGGPGGSFFKKRPLAVGDKLYKTGDLARWLPDGNIEFLGRLDHQVKIRGFRIELGEIENQLFNDDHIKEAVVTTNEDKNGDKYLCAYIVPHSPQHFEISHLQRHLEQKLPGYMIPAYFVQLERIPLSPAGKIDRKALPAPGIKSDIQYTAPQNKIEEQLVEIWSGVLGIQEENIGSNYNFFKLGGHSLKAARLLARIHKQLDVEISLAQMFENPTVSGLADCILKLKKIPLRNIEAVEKKEYYEPSASQKRFFVFWQWRPIDFSYNISEIMVIEGLLSREKFARIFKQLINRHESLRTSFHLVNSDPVQLIHDEVEFEIEYYKVEDGDTGGMRGLPPLPEESAVAVSSPQPTAALISSFIRPFDLARAPLVRLGLAKIQEEKYFLMFDMHHIISDGVSMGIFIKELLALHAGEQLPPPRIQYKDYVEWEKKKQKQKKSKKTTLPQRQYRETTLNLPLDFSRPAVSNFKGNTIKFNIEGLERAAKLLSLQEDITLFMVLLAAFNVFLSKISGQENIVVGSPIAGRQHPDLEGMIGLLINPLALQNFPRAHKRFSDFLTEVKSSALEAFENQEDQYEEMLKKVIPSRHTGYNPLYDVMFVLQNMEMPDIEIPGLKVIREVGNNPSAKFDITLYYEEFSSSFIMEYATELFKPGTIQRFIGYFKKVVEQILENPYQTIAGIEIISQEEKQQLLYDFNDTVVEYPSDRCIYQLIADQVQRTPDNLAVIQFTPDESSGSPFTLTYHELNARSNQLARLLRKRGIKTNTVVGMMMKRSREMLIGILGILKAGGAYLPVDSQYPENRIANMLENSQASFLLTQRTIVEEKSLCLLAQKRDVEILPMDELAKVWEKEPGKNLKPLSSPNDLIYIIFTSGSTGIPKGAGVYHRGFVNLLHWFVTEFDFNHNDRNLLLTSLSFDLTQKNFYASLISGGRFCIPGFSYFEPRPLVRLIQEYRVTWINCTPSMFYKLVEYKTMNEDKQLSSLRYVFLGGEPISISNLIDWLESGDCHAEIVNTYGPTECTDISNFYRIKQPRRFLEEVVPIGQPVYNVQLYVPDKNLQMLPVGIAGELYIGGVGVGIGYFNDEQLTSQKFIRHSFDPNQPEQLLYRTGDLVKWLPDGNIEFLGRIDHQVKVRGFRIELGEIENLLRLHPTVKETLVMARHDEAGEKYLCAYIVPYSTESAAINTTELREYLSRELPGYMVPAYFIVLEKMPLNPNGKVDRKSLPEPDLTLKDSYVPPQNDTENRLAEIWAEVLGVEKKQVSIHDNFFLSGGHSLKATTLIGKIHKTFCVEIPIAEIFKQPTIEDISHYLQQSRESIYLSIVPVEKREYYPLFSAQKRLFVIEQMDPGNITYNISAVWKLEGKLDINCLAESFNKLIARHESLKTSFQLIAGEPVQKVHDDVEFEIEYDQSLVNCQGRGEVSSPVEIGTVIRDFIRPFDLSKAPLLRVGLMKLPHTPAAHHGHRHFSQEGKKDKYLLMIDMHHIISDAMTVDIFTRDFMALYAGEVLSGLRIYYKDYSQWQNQGKNKEKVKLQEASWTKEFKGEIPVLDLPTDYARPAVQSFEGKHLNFQLQEEKTRAIKKIALEEDATIFMVLIAIFNILLAKISGQEDIVVGSPVAGRTHADVKHIIGLFINTLALRNYPSAEKTFTGFLGEVRERTLTALENQDYQFEDLVEKVTVNRDMSRNPLFDAMFVLQNAGIFKIDIPGLTLRACEYETGMSKFDLTFNCEEVEEKLIFTVEFRTKLFLENTIKRFIDYFKKIVSLVTGNSKLRIGEIEILPGKEREQVLYDFNDTAVPYPKDQTIHQLFSDQAEKTPDHVALVALEGTRGLAPLPTPISITYRKLNETSNQLARILRKQAIKPNTAVGIMMERSVEMLVAILAVLKAGGLYLPIDPEYPSRRIVSMLTGSGASILFTQREILERESLALIYRQQHLQVIPVDQLTDQLQEEPGENLDPIAGPNDLIYIIFTSGSTGTPKGAGVYHRGFMNLMHWFVTDFGLHARDTNLLLTSLSFDLTQKNLYASLLTGGRLCIPGFDHFDPLALLEEINNNHVTWINCTPSMFYMLVEYEEPREEKRLSSLRYVFLGGEPISVPKLIGWLESGGCRAEIVNTYGPTECTDICAFYRIRQPRRFLEENVPLGKPVYNSQLFVLNKDLQPLPIGTPGELVIGGAGVGIGYVNDATMTSQKFFRLLFSYNEPKRLLYRTGDRVKRRADGNIEFLGRMDYQVKLRGYRIEMGEIESRLSASESVTEAVVVAQKDTTGGNYLCAYVVPAAGKEFESKELRKELSHSLPGYMVPSFFVRLDKIPLTPNGKIDRKALPEPGVSGTGKEYTAPGNEIEKKLVDMWEKELGTNPIGIHDNFFELGGHSLAALRVLNKIHRTFGVEITIQNLFQFPFIAGVARLIQNGSVTGCEEIEKQPDQPYYDLSYSQKRLWYISRREPDSPLFNMPFKLTLNEAVDEAAVQKTLEQLAVRHESLRTSFKMIDKKPVQVVEPPGQLKLKIEVLDWSQFQRDEKEQENSRHRLITEESSYIFNLEAAPLLRVRLIKWKAGEYDLVFNMHHMISDGWSLEILRHEFNCFYEAFKKGTACEMEPLRLQYKDYAAWQNRLLADEKKMASAKEFWKDQLRGTLPVLNLPYDFSRPGDSKESAAYRRVITEKVTLRLRQMAIDCRASLFMVLLAGFNIFLSKITGQDEIIIAIPAAARQHEELKNIVGLFVNTLIIRTNVNSGEDFADFFKRLLDNMVRMLEYQGIPLELICGQLKIKYPTIPVFFNMTNIGTANLEKLTNLENFHMDKVQDAKFEMVCYVNEYQNGIDISCHYFKDRFKPLSIEKLMELYENILDNISTQPAKKIEEYTLTGKERTLKRKSKAGAAALKLIRKK